MNVAPTTQYFTRVLIPSNGAVLAGSPYLDAAAGDGPGVIKVVFEVSGGTLERQGDRHRHPHPLWLAG